MAQTNSAPWSLRIGSPDFHGGDHEGYSPATPLDPTTAACGSGSNVSKMYEWMQRTPNFNRKLLLTPPANLRGTGLVAGDISFEFPPGTTPAAIQNFVLASIAALTGAELPTAVAAGAGT